MRFSMNDDCDSGTRWLMAAYVGGDRKVDVSMEEDEIPRSNFGCLPTSSRGLFSCMASYSTSSSDIWLCPFRSFHLCPNGEVGSKGSVCMISHIKRHHLLTEDHKCLLREALSSDVGLFIVVEETLKAFGQWMCGKCMTFHVVSRYCHHPDGVVSFITGDDGPSRYIVSILKSYTKESTTNVLGGLVFDVGLLDRVFKVPITTVKSIPHNCRLSFYRALKTTLYKVIAQPGSVDAWICLLLLPHCTLQKILTTKLHLEVLGYMGEKDGISTLVKNMLDNPKVGPMGQGGGFLQKESNTDIRQCLCKTLIVYLVALNLPLNELHVGEMA
uniref:Uncharacterized protein n=1 Tax=Lactuca sativa TaxID=4236 RepID=A0A9R1V880_LACSA|nr:hypothetical protein LSAT_V11C600300330 [Lactuca sativa]